MKISEIMTRSVRTFPPDASVKDAMKALLSQKISGLPVVDSSGKLIGMFTEKDILKNILPSYVSQVGKFSYENSPKTMQNKVTKLSEMRVVDLMRKDVVSVSEDAPVYEVAHIMLTQNVRRVPVVDPDKKMIGIVSRSDVLEAVLKV